MDRIILHCDLNSFYASVELLDHPELRQKPVAVSGDPEIRHGVILAKNEAAKALGVKTGETIWQARQKCPKLTLLPAHHDQYARYSKLAGEIYERYTDLVEPFGIDESWLDLTGSIHLFGGDGKLVADEIRATMKQELGLTISVGVSFNKIFAKLGSDYRKPDATTVIDRAQFRKVVWPLPVSDLLFVGKNSAQILARHGIRTIGELANTSPEGLIVLLGKQGQRLHRYANGEENSPVLPADLHIPPKSVGKGVTFPRNLQGTEEMQTAITLLADRVAVRLRRLGQKCSTVNLTIRPPSFQDLSRQKKMEEPTYLTRDIANLAMDLLLSCWNPSEPIRALTVTASGLVPEQEVGEQLNLFYGKIRAERQKRERLEKTMDQLREKYGNDMIGFASSTGESAKERKEK